MKKIRIFLIVSIICLVAIYLPTNIIGSENVSEDEYSEIPSSFSTPLQAALAETLYTYDILLGEDVPSAQYIDYNNGTSLTILDYHNGTIKHIIETFTIGNVLISTTESDPLLQVIPTVYGEATEILTKTQDVLMGFTISLPTISWHLLVEDPIFGFDFLDVGIEFAFGFGLRLPVQITLKYPSEMAVEHDYTLTAQISSLNWDSIHYQSAGLTGIAGEQYEFLCKFLTKFWLEVFELDIVYFEQNIDESRNFWTPIGPDMQFPIPSIPVDLTGIISAILHVDISSALGISLELEPVLTSTKITADWAVSGDAYGGGTLIWTDNNDIVDLNLDVDDISPIDFANIRLTNFKYYFNSFSIKFIIVADFRGIIGFIPDIRLNLFTLNLDWLLGGGLPLGTHSGTIGNIDLSIFVEKFEVDLTIDPPIQGIIPGDNGVYDITVTNKGNVPDTFSLYVEDLPAEWQYDLSSNIVSLDPGESTIVTLSISPYRHWSTFPGDYEFNVKAVSNEAPLRDLSATDTDSAIVHVLPFHEVALGLVPANYFSLPGDTKIYSVELINLGNVADQYNLQILCYEKANSWPAFPRKIMNDWITLYPSSLLLDPGAIGSSSLTIHVPSEWAGMINTEYFFNISTACVSDDSVKDSKIGSLTILPTKESKTRYIDYELQWFSDEVLDQTIPDDIKLSLMDHLIASINKKEQALEYILEGREKQANNMLTACQNIVNALISFIEAQSEKGIPMVLADKWIQDANLIYAHLNDTIQTSI